MDLIIIKTASGLFAPYGEEAQAACAGVKVGQLLQGKFTRMRNYEFHKKFFALMQIGFDIWSDSGAGAVYKGEVIAPNLDRFRKDITILAGFYETSVRLDNTVRIEAKSIGFGSMDQIEFEQVYSKCIDVILKHVMRPGQMTEEQLRARVDEVLRFDQ